MKFLIDANLPPGLAEWLKTLGHQAEHVVDAQGVPQDDRGIFDYARATNSIVVTKDEDFAALATLLPNSAAVLWIRFGNVTNRALHARLGSSIDEIMSKFAAGERLVEIV